MTRGLGIPGGGGVGRAVGGLDGPPVWRGVGVTTTDGVGATCDDDALHAGDSAEVDAGGGTSEPDDEGDEVEVGAAGPQPVMTSATAMVSQRRGRSARED